MPPKYEGSSFPYGAPATVKPIGAMHKKELFDAHKKEVFDAQKAKNDDIDVRRISIQKLNPHKCADPFQSNVKKCKTSFSQSYISGAIPCRLQSTASRYFLQWDEQAASGFSPDLLVVCADGLTEADHPYVVMAPMMFMELCLRSEGCVEMFSPVIERVATSIRAALMCQHSFDAGLGALSTLLTHSGNAVMAYLPKLVPCLARPFADRKKKDSTAAVLGLIETQCGPEATKIIKAKIPTY